MPHSGSEKTVSSRESPLAKNRSRILVMDSSEHIRTLLIQLLSLSGHEAIVAAEGGEALDLYRKAMDTGRPFDAVILDLSVVHGMDAMETVGRLQAIDRNVRAIISSAFLCGPTDVYKRHGFLGVLPKPFTIHDLQRTVTSVLAHGRA